MESKLLAPYPSHAELTRTLVSLQRFAALSTLALDPAGYPFGSFVNFASDAQGDILLFTSDLAEHTQNFKVDARASLMVAEGSLISARATLVGDILRADEAKAEFLERNPDAQFYAEFRDFACYRLRPEAIRYVGGFGRMSWVDVAEYRSAQPDPLAPHQAGILEHMNDDHRDAMVAMARQLGEVDCEDAEMISIDRYGFDLRLKGAIGKLRLGFPTPLASYSQVRPELVRLTRAARQEVSS